MKLLRSSLLLICVLVTICCDKDPEPQVYTSDTPIFAVTSKSSKTDFPFFTKRKCKGSNKIKITASSPAMENYNLLWWTDSGPLGHGIQTPCICNHNAYVRVTNMMSELQTTYQFYVPPCRKLID